MRSAMLVVLAVALLASTGCGGRTGCYEVSSVCTVTCAALPDQVFSGSITTSGYWMSGEPADIPVSTINGICQEGTTGPHEAAACFSATPFPDRPASISCDCDSWTVTKGDSPCPTYIWH